MLVGVVCVSTSLPVIRRLAVHCKFNVQERTVLAQFKKKKEGCLFANSTTDGTADRKGVFSVLVINASSRRKEWRHSVQKTVDLDREFQMKK